MSANPTYDERALFALIAEGKEDAFRRFFRQYHYRLRPLLTSLARSEEGVDDIIQETMIRIWLNRDKLVDIENPRAWINKVAANACFTYLRRQQRFRENTFSGHSAPQDAHDQGYEHIDLRQLRETVQLGIAGLSAQRRKVYTLSRDHGMTVPEIASQLGLSANTVRNTLTAAMEQIRDYLAKQGYAPFIIFMMLHFF